VPSTSASFTAVTVTATEVVPAGTVRIPVFVEDKVEPGEYDIV
jgi:hypothetical protein